MIQELSLKEMKEIDGGVAITTLVLCAVASVAGGFGIGYVAGKYF